MAARRRLPAGYRPQRLAGAVSPATQRGFADALAALQGEGDTPTADEAIAQREQWRVLDEGRRQPQGCLSLEVRR